MTVLTLVVIVTGTATLLRTTLEPRENMAAIIEAGGPYGRYPHADTLDKAKTSNFEDQTCSTRQSDKVP
jgi:hypothetical protein